MEENFEKPPEESFPISGYKTAKSYSQDTLCSILAAVKASNALPSAGDDADFYRSFKGFRKIMSHEGQSILSLMTSLLQKQNVRESFQGRELDEKFDLLVEVNEVILDNISNCLDEACGLRKSEEELILAVKPQSSINTSWNKKQFNSSSSQSYRLLAAKNVTRPQLTFKDKIDNSNSPFVPIIKYKPNSIKPLAITVERDNDKEEFCHPYEWEIEKFNVPEEALQEVEPIMPKPLDETPFVFVKSEEDLKNLCNELRKQKEFAVDLEHHSYRSFQGFTCLMQISTRDTDYIIDVIDLRSELHVLNEVFTDPKIVKVFHGADMDVIWLQRDFGIYVVNMFDTGQAARVLHYAHLSLSYLLKHYCRLDLDKQFQLADWRIRPLPNEMIKYARQDTHYLLYVYDCLRKDLIKSGNETKNLLRSTFERSKIICLKKYQKPIFSEDKYIELYKKTKKILNAKQLYCLKELYSWRNKIARETDESVAYVLPNHMLLQIAEALPREQQGILACCNPVPPLVKQQLNELHNIVLKANDSSVKELALLELQKKAQNDNVKNQIDLTTDLIRCPHDILHVEEKKVQTSDSNTVLPLLTKEDAPVVYLRKEPTLTALFENFVVQSNKNTSQFNKVSDVLSKLYSPYQRYKMTEKLQMNVETLSTENDRLDETTASCEDKSNIDQDPEEDSCIITEDNSAQSISNTYAQLPTKMFSSTPLRKITEDNFAQSISNTTADLPPSNSPDEIFSPTPLRKKGNKKKKRKLEPDISLNSTPISSLPPPKKSKTPEVVVIDEDKFEPYDYSKTDFNAFSGKKKSKGNFRPQMQHDFKGPGRHFGRNKKHFKQGTFSGENKQVKKKWPQKK